MDHQGIIFEYNKNEKDCWICRNEEWNRCIVTNDTFFEETYLKIVQERKSFEFTGKDFNQEKV